MMMMMTMTMVMNQWPPRLNRRLLLLLLLEEDHSAHPDKRYVSTTPLEARMQQPHGTMHTHFCCAAVRVRLCVSGPQALL